MRMQSVVVPICYMYFSAWMHVCDVHVHTFT